MAMNRDVGVEFLGARPKPEGPKNPPPPHPVPKKLQKEFLDIIEKRYEYDHGKTPEHNGLLLAVADARSQTAKQLMALFEFE